MKYIRKTSIDIGDNYSIELLKERGILNNDKFDWYFNPTINNLHSPYDLDHMQEGINLFISHIKNGSHIKIYLDCDVDGFTSGAVLYNYCNMFLSKRFPDFKLSYHVPLGKEHGLKSIMEEFDSDKICDLIVLPDSSSNDYEEHKFLKDNGYDILVLDHHEAEHYSENAVVINNQLSRNYKNKNASGVGIVFKFLCALANELHFPIEEVYYFLDLVALGEISDMMSMQTSENRFICEYGLSHINNPMFLALLEKQCYSIFGSTDWEGVKNKVGEKLTQTDVAFYVAPLINALIRVGNQNEKEKLFKGFISGEEQVKSTKRGASTDDFETISEQSARNCVNARSRQNREKEKAMDLLDIQISNDCLDSNKILILNADDLNVSTTLTGLIAMGIAAKYKKPTIIGRTSPDGYLKGSMRGQEGSALKDFRTFLLDSGYPEFVEGHDNASGVSIKISDIDKLYEYANIKLADVDFNEGFYEVDFILNANYSKMTDLIIDLGSNTKLWGQGNQEPLLAIENLTIPKSSMQIIGSKKDTIKFVFNGISYMIFKAEKVIEQLNKFDKDDALTITCIGRPNLNHWGNRITPQIYINDIEIKKNSLYDF